jgi:hypothetical protein
MPAKDNIRQVFKPKDIRDVLDMSVEINIRVREVNLLPQAR